MILFIKVFVILIKKSMILLFMFSDSIALLFLLEFQNSDYLNKFLKKAVWKMF